MENSNPQVFISYSRKNKKEADKLCNVLKAKNITYFIDRRDIETGSEFDQKIIDAINNCGCVVFLQSTDSINSEWVFQELLFAKNKQKTIFPLSIDSTPLNDRLSFTFPRLQTTDFQSLFKKNKTDLNNFLLLVEKELAPCGTNNADLQPNTVSKITKKEKNILELIGIICCAIMGTCVSIWKIDEYFNLPWVVYQWIIGILICVPVYVSGIVIIFMNLQPGKKRRMTLCIYMSIISIIYISFPAFFSESMQLESMVLMYFIFGCSMGIPFILSFGYIFINDKGWIIFGEQCLHATIYMASMFIGALIHSGIYNLIY